MSQSAITSEPILFKQDFSPEHGWMAYAVAVVILLFIVLILGKKLKPRQMQQSACHVIEKKQLSHKTIVYVIEYHQQVFVLADNQHALAIHPVTPKAVHEPI